MLNNTLGNNTLGNNSLEEWVVKMTAIAILAGTPEANRIASRFLEMKATSRGEVSFSIGAFIERMATAQGVAISQMADKVMTRIKMATAEGIPTGEKGLTLKRARAATAGGVVSIVKKIGKTFSTIAGGVAIATKIKIKVITKTAIARAETAVKKAKEFVKIFTAKAKGIAKTIIPDRYFYKNKYKDNDDDYSNKYNPYEF